MRLVVSTLLIGLVAACSVSHQEGTADAATQDAEIAEDARVAARDAGPIDPPTSDAAVLADAFVAEDAPPAMDAAPGDAGPSCAPEGSGPPPRFRDLYATVIAPNGCGTGCHQSGSLWESTLDLSSPEAAYRTLVNVLGCDDELLRVSPCHPEDSSLSIVPTLRAEPCGGRHTFGGGYVTPDEAEQIDAWIRMGAVW